MVQRLHLSLAVGTVVAGLGLALPAGIAVELYHREDRTDDFVAYDYGYNILQSCDRDSMLFANGDNDILVNDYTEFDQAAQLYRQVITKNPGRWDAYYELAVTLQANGDAQEALDLLTKYRSQHGQVEQLMQAEQILQRYLERTNNKTGHTL